MKQVDNTVDLLAVASPFDVLILYLLAAGFSQTEISEMTYCSRQAINDRRKRLTARYQTGKEPPKKRYNQKGR